MPLSFQQPLLWEGSKKKSRRFQGLPLANLPCETSWQWDSGLSNANCPKKMLHWGKPLRGPFPPVSPWRYVVPGTGRRWYFGLPPCTAFWLPNLATPSSRICLLLLSLTSLHTHITSGLLLLGHHPSWFYPNSSSSHDTTQWCLLCGALLAPPWAQGSWLFCSQCNVFLFMSPYCTVMHWSTCLSPQFDCAVLRYKN